MKQKRGLLNIQLVKAAIPWYDAGMQRGNAHVDPARDRGGRARHRLHL